MWFLKNVFSNVFWPIGICAYGLSSTTVMPGNLVCLSKSDAGYKYLPRLVLCLSTVHSIHFPNHYSVLHNIFEKGVLCICSVSVAKKKKKKKKQIRHQNELVLKGVLMRIVLLNIVKLNQPSVSPSLLFLVNTALV